MTRNKVYWAFVGIASIYAICGGTGTAYAASTAAKSSSAGGISIGGGLKPVNDPVYDYIFDVELLPGATISYHDTFTVDNLVGITSTSLSGYVGNYDFGNGVPNNLDPVTPKANVTWKYLDLASVTATTATGPIFLGEFTIQTTVQYPLNNPPFDIGASITYSSDLGGVVNNGGVLLVSSVPEPSSAILLVLGGVMGLPALLMNRRRRLPEPN